SVPVTRPRFGYTGKSLQWSIIFRRINNLGRVIYPCPRSAALTNATRKITTTAFSELNINVHVNSEARDEDGAKQDIKGLPSIQVKGADAFEGGTMTFQTLDAEVSFWGRTRS
ncbi:MAG TPA: hypothetical protein VEI57_08335, partial [Nitrospirota bacterium]|nr:hypothetical protein [Nitrospirota bacterium]